MKKTITTTVMFLLLLVSVSQAELVGKKECAKGAVESGDKLLQTCVDSPENSAQEMIDGPSYESFDMSNNIQFVLPEVTTQIFLSSTDINRIICPPESEGEVHVVHSAEKGLNTKTVGKDVFVKFNIIKKIEDGKETLIHSTVPTDMYVICGGEVYSMIVIPKRIPSQMVKLSTGVKNTIKKNLSMYSGMAYEKKIIDIIKSAYIDNIPESFTVHLIKKPVDMFKDILMVFERIIVVDGVGLELKEYSLSVKDSSKTDTLNLTEKEFLKPDIAGRGVVAISLDTHQLSKGDRARLFIVTARKEGTYMPGGSK